MSSRTWDHVAHGFGLANVTVWTMDASVSRAEAILVEGDQIRSAGEERAIVAKAHRAGLPLQDGDGLLVLPGLIDSHTHLLHQGLLRQRLDLQDTRSLEEALRRVARRLRTHPANQLLLAERWDESRWKERRFPHREELDALSAKVPIILRRVDGHVAVGNRRACQLVASRLPGVDPETGLLVEDASLHLNQVFPTPLPEATQALRSAQRQALQLGVTSVHDFVIPTYLRAYQELRRRGELHLRAFVSLYVEFLGALERIGATEGWGDESLALVGIKLFADGSLGGQTAALSQPYREAPGRRGRLNWTDDGLQTAFRRAHTAGLRISAHAIGDAAIGQVVRSYHRLGGTASRRRHRIEHFELHTPETVRSAVDLGLVLSMQPNFVGKWCRPGGMYHQRLGSPRNRRNNEFRNLLRSGATLAFGSDCMPFDPWFGLDSCLNAPYPAQRLPVEEALRAYTMGGAIGLQRENRIGSIAPGKLADFILVKFDSKRPKSIGQAQVRATFVGGRRRYARRPPLK